MKVTGIVRKLDAAGRFTIPVELRHLLGIKPGDMIEFLIGDSHIILHKFEIGCLFCGGDNRLSFIKGRKVCRSCLYKAASLLRKKKPRFSF